MTETTSYQKKGLAPLVGEDPVVLILGSLPGDESIRKQEYYANPRNLFWRVLAGVFAEPVPLNYPDKTAFLRRHGIALWDVLHAADRKGSVDKNIRKGEPNDIPAFLKEYPGIRAIILNGGKAARDFRKIKRSSPNSFQGIAILEFTSTSPLSGSAGWPPERILQQWKEAFPGAVKHPRFVAAPKELISTHKKESQINYSSHMSTHLYTDLWEKYRSLINQLLENGGGSIELSPEEFRQRGNRSSYSFRLVVSSGEIPVSRGNAVARDLKEVLDHSATFKKNASGKTIVIRLDSDFRFTVSVFNPSER